VPDLIYCLLTWYLYLWYIYIRIYLHLSISFCMIFSLFQSGWTSRSLHGDFARKEIVQSCIQWQLKCT
jgi:hypothetical protein